jgi:hypothetical protein
MFTLTAFSGTTARRNADGDARQERGGDQRQESFRIASKPGVDSLMVSKTDHRYEQLSSSPENIQCANVLSG